VLIPNLEITRHHNAYLFSARSLSEPMKANRGTMAVASHYDARCSDMYSYVSGGENGKEKR
jgi:hypothetical protein